MTKDEFNDLKKSFRVESSRYMMLSSFDWFIKCPSYIKLLEAGPSITGYILHEIYKSADWAWFDWMNRTYPFLPDLIINEYNRGYLGRLRKAYVSWGIQNVLKPKSWEMK